jgi:excisionase family DNA binding protein
MGVAAVSKLLTVHEVASMLRVSVPTVRSWTYQRRLPVVKLGRRVLYREDDIRQFIEKGYRPASPQNVR